MSQDFSGTLKITTVWCLLGLAVFLGFTAWQRHETQLIVTELPGGNQILSLTRGRDGHYHLPAQLNGQEVVFLVDTGASMTSVSAELANALLLPKQSSRKFSTANGEIQADVVLANLTIAETIEFRQLRIAALPTLKGQALLGMDVLGKFALSQENGVMSLRLNRP